ncbi:MAG TPA: glycosyltransferase [Nitrospiraceae bacterium]|nr:glycosyltransferase [Nitrospiraceae bacterium]
MTKRPAGLDPPRGAVSTVATAMPRSDFIGLAILALLLLSPLMFKFRVAEGLVVHPFVPLLIAAWIWVAWTSRRTFTSFANGWYIAEWQAWNVPVLLLGLSVVGLAFSLAVNSIRLGSLQATGWLLLAKWLLYLAPLPLTTLLALRRQTHVIRLVSYLVPLVAFGTLLYSSFRLWQAMEGRYSNVYVDSSSRFFAMGMMAEVLTPDGIAVRSDTMGHTAYGMYLSFVLIFSLSLALFRGWDGLVPRRYASVQAVVLGPLIIGGILLSGSRSSLVLLGSAVIVFLMLLLLNVGDYLSRQRRVVCATMLLLAPITVLLLHGPFSAALPTLDRFEETLESQLDIERTASGQFSPLLQDDDRTTRRSVKNLQIRVWIWGQAVRYLMHHPGTMLLGIGYDRRRFVEDVIGLPYEGPNINYQTAHNVFLDILIKGGIVPLIPFLAACVWLFWAAVTNVIIPVRERDSISRIGIGWVLMSFWPALMLASFTGEELLTDNLLLHWSMLFGLLLGLGGLALAAWLPNRTLHMTATAGIGGGPTYITAVARHQQAIGKQVRIFCSNEKPFVEIWQKMGVDVSVLPMRRPNLHSVWQLLKELLRAPAPIHAHGRGAAFFALWVKMLVRIPVIYTPHGPHYAYKSGWRYVPSWCFEFLFRLFLDAVLYVSHGERETAQRQHLPVRRSRVVISGLIRDESAHPGYQATRESLLHEWNIPTDRFVIGWIGRFDYAKGLDLLLASIPEVSSHVPNAVWVIIGGGDGQAMRHWKDRVADSGQSEKVVFLGARTDACDLLRVFDLYVSTSRWEGLPLVLLEAMEQGVPIVASDVVGNRDILKGWGCLFPACDVMGAAAAQVRLATDASLRASLAKTGQDVRRKRFTCSRMLNELDSAYREILGVRFAG